MPTADLAFTPLERTADLYYRESGAVFGPIQVDVVADALRLISVAGIVTTYPRTAAGLNAAVIDARTSARIGEDYSGAIDFLLAKPRVAKHGRGSLVR